MVGSISDHVVKIYSMNCAEFSAGGKKVSPLKNKSSPFVLAARRFSAQFYAQLCTLEFLGS